MEKHYALGNLTTVCSISFIIISNFVCQINYLFSFYFNFLANKQCLNISYYSYIINIIKLDLTSFLDIGGFLNLECW